MLIELAGSLPFVVLLAAIAVMPLANKRWWEKYFSFVSFGLALLVIVPYALRPGGPAVILHTASEYFSFICLTASLFVVAGGILIGVRGEAAPAANSLFLLSGAALANVLGTTGASMVLLRPWIRMNQSRFKPYHVVFFIFIVSNIGGALTPIGDPPLFLGYLKGVPFFWVMKRVWVIWAASIVFLAAVFFAVDSLNFKRAPAAVRAPETARGPGGFSGRRNLIFLGMIIGAVFLNHPPFLREGMLIAAAALSYLTTPKQIRTENDFDFAPIKEVAILFAGIFATMIPALEWLERHSPELGIVSPGQFFWGSGILSSVLDNAPTYLNFLSAAAGLQGPEGSVAQLLAHRPEYILAISVGAVFFGAATYIGNGPNFLVKSIAEKAGVPAPSFFGYILKYSLPILLPLFFAVWYFSFRPIPIPGYNL